MEKQNNLPHNPDGPNEQQPTTDLRELVNRHLQDPNHVITEEEMRSVRVGVDAISSEDLKAPAYESIREDDETANKNDSDSDDLDERPVTPWDVKQ